MPIGLTFKTIQNWPFTCWKPSNETKVILTSLHVSAILYSVQLTWAHNWIGHEKLPQIDPSYVEIHQIEPKFWQDLCIGQLFCTVFSWFEVTVGLALKNYPKWTHHKLKFFHIESWINIRYLPNHTKPSQTKYELFYGEEI